MNISIKTIITCILCLVAVGFVTYVCRDVYISSIQEKEESVYIEQKTKKMDSTIANEIHYDKLPTTTTGTTIS